MAQNERKRQEKLARKAAKRKKQLAGIRSAAATSISALSPGRQLQLAAGAPVFETLIPENLFDMGIGNVVFSRMMPNGDIAVSVFLLDVYCLGVKNAYFKVVPDYEYRSALEQYASHGAYTPVEPACLRKLVEEAEAYASDLGFSPHPDYQVSRLIFGDVDPGTCPTRFVFGKDGKPFYMSGPYDSLAKSRKIMDTLAKRCGPGNFHGMIALREPPPEDLFENANVYDAAELEAAEPDVEEPDDEGSDVEEPRVAEPDVEEPHQDQPQRRFGLFRR
jgi:hypothetical protein